MKSNLLIEFLDSIYEKISTYSTSDRKIFVHKGEIYNINNKNLQWREVKLPYKWDTSNDIYLKKEIVVPEKIFNIDISNSRLEIFGPGYRKLLDSFVRSVVLLHGELYIDGKKQFEEKNWCDLRYRKTITEKVTPGDSHIVLFHFFKRDIYKDEYSRFLNIFEIFYSNIDEIMFEIKSLSAELSYIKNVLKKDCDLEMVLKDVDLDKLKDISANELTAIIKDIKDRLRGLKINFKKHKVYLIGHAHIDINWQWDTKETLTLTRDTFNNIEVFMKQFGDFNFSQSQAFLYSQMEKNYPKVFNNIKKRVDEGRWELTASSWVEMDLNMLSGESIVRQILYAKRYIKEKFDFEPEVFWAPDAFGHSWSLPQILKKSNINYYYFMRGFQSEEDLFWWEGIDGSKVLAFNSIYFGNVNTGRLYDLVKNSNDKNRLNESMYVYGICNHGGGPTLYDIETVRKLNSDKLFPELKFSKTLDYFKIIRKKVSKVKKNICREFNPVFDGTYTSHNDIKCHNRHCERLLIQNEILGSIIELLGGKYNDLEKYWKDALVNQFHDTIAGCSVKINYNYAIRTAKLTEKYLNKLLYRNMRYLFENISYTKKGIPVLVFNSLSWDRNDLVKVKITNEFPDNPLVTDKNGNTYRSQVNGGELVFIAGNVPAVGYKVFYISDSVKTDPDNESLIANGFKLENDFYVFNINPENGIIENLYDKKNKKTVMKYQRDEGDVPEESFFIKKEDSRSNCQTTEPMMNNLLQILYEDPHPMSSWTIGPVSEIKNLIDKADVEIISNGPVFAEIRITRKFNRSKITQNIWIYKDIERIDFINILEWKEKSGPKIKAPMLRASFTPILKRSRAFFEIPYGSIERIADGQQYPALKWADISDEDYGISILTDTKHGFSVSGNTISITISRTSHEPDPDPERGRYFFTYSLYPHRGNIKDSETVRKGFELNNPLISYTGSKIEDGNFLENKSFIEIDRKEVILTCFKKAESGDGFIIRVYESKGREVNVRIGPGFKFSNIVEVDLMENSVNRILAVEGDTLFFGIRPFEIRTFEIFI